MIKQERTATELLTEFHNDALRWKSILGHAENELLFIKRLLTSGAFKENTPNLFERLEHFKSEIDTKTQELASLQKEIQVYETSLNDILARDTMPSDAFYQENHKTLKQSFNDFYIHFNEYKTEVFNYTGSIL